MLIRNGGSKNSTSPPHLVKNERSLRKKNETAPESRQTLEVAEARNFWTSQCSFLSSNWFSECEHPFIYFISEPAVPSACARILALCWKLYTGNMQRVLTKDLI